MTAQLRVLYVDDDSDTRDTVTDRVEGALARCTVHTVTGCDAAIRFLDTTTVDCVVSEYDLPDESGLDLLSTVRERQPRLPFVLFTGGGSESVASRAISAGVTDYVQRGTPDSYAALADSIENAVDQHRAETDLHESERELRRKSEMLDIILDHVPLHIYIKDEEARHSWVSDYYLGANEQLGKTDAEYFDQAWAEETYREELEIIDTGEPIIKQTRYDPDREMWVLNSKVPWTDQHGDVVGLVGATWDITERKEAKLELQRQTERLSKFIRALSHDLQTPLHLASSQLELMRETVDHERIDAIAEAHDRMERIIDETLKMAKRGETVGETEPVELGALARESWSTIETDGATLTVESDGTVDADGERLRRLLENLFANAVTHAARPETTLSVTVGTLDGGFYVEDDGPGVPPDERADIFEIGYTTADEGTGFGLAIVEEIAGAHGWTVRITDGADGGARFVVDVEAS